MQNALHPLLTPPLGKTVALDNSIHLFVADPDSLSSQADFVKMKKRSAFHFVDEAKHTLLFFSLFGGYV